MSVGITFALMLALLLVKGFFSGSEIGMISADRVRLRLKASEGHSGAKHAVRLLNQPARFLTTTLLGTNISSIALTTVGTLLIVDLLGSQGELFAIIIFAPLFLILGEIVPKSVYQQRADGMAPIIAYPLGWMQTVLSPLIWMFSGVASLAVRLTGGGKDDATAAREQFMATVQMAEKTGAIEAFGRGQVRRVLRYAQMTAEQAMWPISKIQCAGHSSAMTELVRIRRSDDQRLIPLVDTQPGKIKQVVVLESWDLLDPRIEARDPSEFYGAVRFVPKDRPTSEIIEVLHDDPSLTIVVVDEDEQALGLITLNLLVRRTLGAKTNPLIDRSEAS